MFRILTLVIATLGLAAAVAASAEETLPTPAGLEPNVRFWTRVYTEVDGHGGLIHDSEHLEIIYEEIRLPQGLSAYARERRVERVKKGYRAILKKLGRGTRTGLSAEERRVLGLWPEGTSNTTYRSAARRVRFQLGQQDQFRAGLIRAGRWAPFIEKELAAQGVPAALVSLPLVESSYNPRAYSRVGAAGLWQFTRATGRRYMRIDNAVDERMDPFKATTSAARLLSDNYRRLRAWPLAITAYNHGVSGMARAVRKVGTRDLGVIARRYKSRTFGFASRNFYSEFLAASAIHADPERYFGKLEAKRPIAYVIVELDHYYRVPSLERALGIDRDTLREHNMALRPAVWNGAKHVPRGYLIRVPAGRLEIPPDQILASIPEPERLRGQVRDRFHKVRRGQTLSKIARRYGVSVRELVSLNNLRSRHRIRVGQVLTLPGGGAAPIQVARTEPPPDGIYRVRRGDTLWVISQRFGVSENELVHMNELRNRHRIAVGQKLRVAPEPTLVAVHAGARSQADAVPAPTSEETVAAAASEAETNGSGQKPRTDQPSPVARAAEVVVARVPAPEPRLRAEAAAAPAPERAPIPLPLPTHEPTFEPGILLGERDDTVVDTHSLLSRADPLFADTAGGALPVAADPSNYAVAADSTITVQAEETLGHYADWLGVSATRLRRLNRMDSATPLVIGRRRKLDFGRVSPEIFEQRRLEFHRTLQEEFFDAWVVSGTRTHVLRRGDSLWYLAEREYEVPVWLIRQYNPDLDLGDLRAGTRMTIPLIEARRT